MLESEPEIGNENDVEIFENQYYKFVKTLLEMLESEPEIGNENDVEIL